MYNFKEKMWVNMFQCLIYKDYGHVQLQLYHNILYFIFFHSVTDLKYRTGMIKKKPVLNLPVI